MVHILVGDGVATNEAAARRLLTDMKDEGIVQYNLLLWHCSAHQSNLVCHVAICGELVKDPAKSNRLCACASRLYKHLSQYVTEECALVVATADEQAAHMANLMELQTLYESMVSRLCRTVSVSCTM